MAPPIVPKQEPVDGNAPPRLQSLSQRSGVRGGGATRARFAPKVVARRSKEERDSTAPQEKVEVKPVVANIRGGRGGGSFGRGGGGGAGRGRGRFEPVVSAAVGPLSAPSTVDTRGSRFSSPGFGFGSGSGGSSRGSGSPFGVNLSSMVSRVKSETPGGSEYSSRATSVEVEEGRIDMTQNAYIDGSLSEYFPVRLDRRGDGDEEEEEEEEEEDEVEYKQEDDGVVKVKDEPMEDVVPSKLLAEENKKKKKAHDHKTKRTEAAIFQEEQLRELSRMKHDHKVIAKEFNMEGKQKKTEGGELDGLEEIEKRLYFFQFPLVMPRFIDDDVEVVELNGEEGGGVGGGDGATTTTTTTTTTSTADTDTHDSPVTETGLPEGRIGKLRLHKSGKLTMIVGDITMDVSQGTECSFLQDVVVIDKKENSAYLIGQVSKKMVLSPELDDGLL